MSRMLGLARRPPTAASIAFLLAVLIATAWGPLPLARVARGAALTPTPVVVDGRVYDAYVPAATKAGQFDRYTCEFDAAWVVFETFGLDVGLEEQMAVIGVDRRVEPYAVETPTGFLIYGGDITEAFSGDHTDNLLARSTGQAMRAVFEHYGLRVTAVHDRVSLERALRRGRLIWMKATVDFLPWQAATWITPEGEEIKTVLGNDHAVVVIGYNADGVVIRDVLGPTTTNWERPYEYEVDWDTFLAVWEAQGFDGLAVGLPTGSR